MNRLKQTATVAMAAGLAMLACGPAAAQVSAPAAGVPAQTQTQTQAQTSAAPGVARGGLHRGEGLMMLDYQSIAVPNNPSLDLLGFHVMNRVADGLYLGVGAYAPMFQGEYGGFMAFDVGATVQRRIAGPLFANAGFAVGPNAATLVLYRPSSTMSFSVGTSSSRAMGSNERGTSIIG